MKAKLAFYIAMCSILAISCNNETKVEDTFDKYLTDNHIENIDIVSVDTIETIKLSKASLVNWKNNDEYTRAKVKSLEKETEKLNEIYDNLSGNMTIGQLYSNEFFVYAITDLTNARLNNYPVYYAINYISYTKFADVYLQKGDTIFVMGRITYKENGHTEKHKYFTSDEKLTKINFVDSFNKYEILAQLASRGKISKHYKYYNNRLISLAKLETESLQNMINSISY